MRLFGFLLVLFVCCCCSALFAPLSGSKWDGKTRDVVRQAKKVIEPLVILPGTPGSWLQARLNNTHPPHFYCSKNHDWFEIYPSKEVLIPGVVDCILYYLDLHYNPTTNTFSNTTGVEIRPIDYGGFNGTYFQNMVENFQKLAGYEEGKTIFGAPFDWRPDGHGWAQDGCYANLKNLIEKVYQLNNGTRVHLLGHSGGAPHGLYFLSKYVSKDWKDKYVKTFITMGGPWLGSAITLPYLANITSLNVPNLPKLYIEFLGHLARTTGLGVMFLPPEKYTSNDVLVTTSTKKYTGADNLQFLLDINATQAFEIRKNNILDYNTLLPPQTELHSIYSYGIDTPKSFVYSSPDFSQLKSVVLTSGDSVVTIESASFCTTWRSQQQEPIYLQGFFNISHDSMQDSPEIWSYILNITTHD